MGYLTPALIYNDTADLLASDPEAGKRIYRAVQLAGRTKREDVPMNNGRMYSSPVTVLEPKHADATRVIVVGQNSIEELAELWYCGSEPESILKALADRLGYRIVKKPVRHSRVTE